MHRLWGAAAAQAGRLLRLLFIWFGAVPADAGTARRRRRGSQPLFGGKGIMTDGSVRASRDWLDSTPVGIVAALLLTVGVRNAIWTAALAWMGLACILNAQRCGHTHCRYTGPYFLAMILPVCILGTTGASRGLSEWIALGVLIAVGGRLLWRATERAWASSNTHAGSPDKTCSRRLP